MADSAARGGDAEESEEAGAADSGDTPAVKTCAFYQLGRCHFGARCRNLHLGVAQKPPTGSEKQCAEGAGLPGAKKAPMRTAAAVVARLQWDTELPREEFTVGYLDRFLGVMEQPFTAFSWGDLASAEPGALAVPEHRIQYFKLGQRVVWDKARRLDDFFGSTGEGTTVRELLAAAGGGGGGLGHSDVARGDASEGQVKGDDRHFDHEVSDGEVGGCDVGNDITLNANEDGITKDSAIAPDDSEDDVAPDDNEDDMAPDDSEDDIAPDDEACSPERSLGLSPGPRRRPNYFVAVRITSEEFQEAARAVQERLVRALPGWGSHCVPLSRLHLTLCPLRLDHPAQVEAARSALRLLGREGQRLMPPTLLLAFGGLRDFGGRVLYAAPRDSVLPELGHLAGELAWRMRDLGLWVPGPQPPRSAPLHVTLAKLPRSQRPELRLLPELYRAWPESQFGCQALDTLSLCATRGSGGADGFYSTVLVVNLY